MRGDLFVGWIPNVAGRLSFSHIGASDYPSKCLKVNYGTGRGRRLAVAQRRKLNDWLLPDWYLKFLYGYSSDWMFVLVAETAGDKFDQVARLEGEIFILDQQSWSSWQSGEAGPLTMRDHFVDNICAWARLSPPTRSDKLDQDLNALRKESLFSFSVKIRRSGVLWMSPVYVASDIKFAPTYVKGETAPSAEDLSYVANQAFFFLKDISHKHQHHPNTSDTITELGKLDRRNSWVIQTHYRIHRKIIELRRSRDPKKLYNASGILAYLNALRKAAHFTTLTKRRGPLTYNHSEIEQSLKSTLEVMKWHQTQMNIIRTAFPVLLIAIVGIAGYSNGELGYYIRALINSSLSNSPGRWIPVVALGMVFAPFYYGVWAANDLPIVVDAKRILVNLPRQLHSAMWAVGAAFFLTLAVAQPYVASLISGSLSIVGMAVPVGVAAWFGVILALAATYLGFKMLPILPTIPSLVGRLTRRAGKL